MCRKQQLEVIVTLWSDSETAQFYVVRNIDGEHSDLLSEGLCRWSRLPSAVCDSLHEVLSKATAAP